MVLHPSLHYLILLFSNYRQEVTTLYKNPFRATFFEHSKLALIVEVDVPMNISQMVTNGRISMISNALKQMARRVSDVI